MARGDVPKPSSSYDSGSEPLHQGQVFHYAIAVLLIATLVVSAIALTNIYQLKKFVIPKTVNVQEFLSKLTSNSEMKGLVGVAPLNIVQINNNNFANLQAQINGLDVSYVGNFIVQYTDRIVIYDYDNNKIKGTVNLQQPQAQLPADFFAKLNKHAELQGMQNQQPVGGQLDANSLNTLKQQFPDVYANAKIGDFLLRYQTRLIIYDYDADRIVNAINLS
ncbi:hypothetical protein HYY70_00260 [Candidatus Woesearchaeota archaeon]|nr:hypothetical protein [Candidatus Woesearchaeota archaeon]